MSGWRRAGQWATIAYQLAFFAGFIALISYLVFTLAIEPRLPKPPPPPPSCYPERDMALIENGLRRPEREPLVDLAEKMPPEKREAMRAELAKADTLWATTTEEAIAALRAQNAQACAAQQRRLTATP